MSAEMVPQLGLEWWKSELIILLFRPLDRTPGFDWNFDLLPSLLINFCTDLWFCIKCFIRDRIPAGMFPFVDVSSFLEYPLLTPHTRTTRKLQPLDKINDNIIIFTQKSCTPLLCLGVVVRINAVFDIHAFIVRFFISSQEGKRKAFSEFLTENLRLSLSQSSLGSIPRSWAAFWIFIPCSSVPVVNTTLRFGAERRAWRANVSAIDKE